MRFILCLYREDPKGNQDDNKDTEDKGPDRGQDPGNAVTID